MAPSARDNYLSTEVLTATPQKLQLMLLDAAIRFAERAKHYWSQGQQDDEASEALNRAQDIVNELLSGLNHQEGGELVRRMAAVYLFVFRRLMEANYGRDEQKLADALRVLSIERDTWRQVCQQHPTNTPAPAPAAPDVHGRHPAPPPYVNDLGPAFPGADGTPTSGFSLEA